jgi:malonate transporter MadL subunit
MYIPIVVAMAAGQNVVAALSGGLVAAIVSIIALTATVIVVRWLNNMADDYDTFTWDEDQPVIDQLS